MNQDQQLSTLVWFLRSDVDRDKVAANMKTETQFKKVLWSSLGNLFNHCLEFYPETRGFSQRIHSTTQSGNQGIYPKQGLFVHPYFNVVLSWPAQGIHSGYRRHLRMANI
jgi:hypothetical protein